MKQFYLSLVFILIFLRTFATHYRAGEITYKRIGDCTSAKYRITVTTYLKTSSITIPGGPDDPSLDVSLGDGTVETFPRVKKIALPDDITISVYEKVHIYPGSGNYNICLEDPNRNGGVNNVPNSINTPFSIHSTLIINPNFCGNNSPDLTYPPIDKGCKGRIFIHNPNAVDPDGDSLSYELTVCRAGCNLQIPGYSYPNATNYFRLNASTGDLTWDSPIDLGEYNVAFYIIEWRFIGNQWIKVGQVERDMQIKIYSCENTPPIISPLPDTCVLAGAPIDLKVTAIDPNGDLITLSSLGAPYLLPNPATFTPDQNNGKNDTVTGIFSWTPGCPNVRRQPYWVEFRAKDNYPDTNLVDLKGLFIRVIGPPPQNLSAMPQGNNMQLTWSPYICTTARRFNIYRRNGAYPGTIDCPCQNGVSSYTGYSLIGSTLTIADTSFTDSNHGAGLLIGNSYCYLITAEFADGSKSCASAQVCAQLKKDLPVMTHVSVLHTDANTGKVYVEWSPATDLDMNAYPPPYQYWLYRSPDFFGAKDTLIKIFYNKNDTTYIDSLIDSDTHEWSYRVELYSDSSGVASLRGSATRASSVFLTITPTDNKLILKWEEHVPWTNYRYDIFRYNAVNLNWDSIATTSQRTYTDTGLENGSLYCYYIRSLGTYHAPDISDTLINFSEEECERPVDNVAPCPPSLSILADCNAETNMLHWTNPKISCADFDVERYVIYYSKDSSHFEIISIVTNADDTVYLHKNLSLLSGCYLVVAIDTAGNQSQSVAVCVDTCRQYVLPNIFTPNHDGRNDFFHPCDQTTDISLYRQCPPYKNVRDVEMKIFNRWGTLVFETNDKDINWNGKNKNSGGECPEGVYYYTCKVNFYTIKGTETKDLKGYIHLIRNDK